MNKYVKLVIWIEHSLIELGLQGIVTPEFIPPYFDLTKKKKNEEEEEENHGIIILFAAAGMIIVISLMFI